MIYDIYDSIIFYVILWYSFYCNFQFLHFAVLSSLRTLHANNYFKPVRTEICWTLEGWGTSQKLAPADDPGRHLVQKNLIGHGKIPQDSNPVMRPDQAHVLSVYKDD